MAETEDTNDTKTYIYACRVIPPEERDVARAHQREPVEMHDAEVGEVRQLSVHLTDEGAEAYAGASNLIEIEEETTASADGWTEDAELSDEAGADGHPSIPHTEDTDYGRSTWLRSGKCGSGVKVAVLDTALGAQAAGMLRSHIAGHKSWGVLVFCAAGNEAQKGNPKRFPGGCASAVAVGAFDRKTGLRAPFSCHGPHVDIAHSGVSVLSYSARGTLIRMSGTSQATPNAVWTAASLMAETGKKGDVLLRGLLSGARKNGSPITHYGAGIMDGQAARTKLLIQNVHKQPDKKPDKPTHVHGKVPGKPTHGSRRLFPRLEGR